MTMNLKAFKTLWEKEKMLVTSIFSFSHDVFNPIKERNHQLRDDHIVLSRVLSVWSHKKILLSGSEINKYIFTGSVLPTIPPRRG